MWFFNTPIKSEYAELIKLLTTHYDPAFIAGETKDIVTISATNVRDIDNLIIQIIRGSKYNDSTKEYTNIKCKDYIFIVLKLTIQDEVYTIRNAFPKSDNQKLMFYNIISRASTKTKIVLEQPKKTPTTPVNNPINRDFSQDMLDYIKEIGLYNGEVDDELQFVTLKQKQALCFLAMSMIPEELLINGDEEIASDIKYLLDVFKISHQQALEIKTMDISDCLDITKQIKYDKPFIEFHTACGFLLSDIKDNTKAKALYTLILSYWGYSEKEISDLINHGKYNYKHQKGRN